jgi:histone-lysine N-methyltransferase SETMAR
VFGLEKVDQKPYDSTIKPMETMQWDELRFSSSRMDPSTGKVMLILFLDAKGIILQHWVPPGQNFLGWISGTWLRKQMPDFSVKVNGFLLQDSATRPHTAKVAMDALTEIRGTPLEHPPYSPDLAPCDFWAFSTTKTELRGNKFRSDQRSAARFREVGEAL